MALMPMFWGRDAILDVESENIFKGFGFSGHSNMAETDAEGGLQAIASTQKAEQEIGACSRKSSDGEGDDKDYRRRGYKRQSESHVFTAKPFLLPSRVSQDSKWEIVREQSVSEFFVLLQFI